MRKQILFAIASILLINVRVSAQSQPDLQTILVSDTMLVLARNISNELKDGRYVTTDQKLAFRLPGKKNKLFATYLYVFDCKAPRRVELISRAFNTEDNADASPKWAGGAEPGYENGFRYEKLKFKSLDQFITEQKKFAGIPSNSSPPWPDDVIPVSEFACRAATRLEKDEDIASEVRKTGGVPDGLQNLTCFAEQGTSKEYSFPVRFHEALGYVQMNNTWKLGSYVTSDTVGLREKSGFSMEISRNTGALSMSFGSESARTTGKCVKSALNQRLF